MQRGVATFTLDYGKCPPWLFERMVKLGREMTHVIVAEFGPDEFVARIADPVWFQALGTVLAFDWNASGLTTILTAALKEAIRGHENDLGLYICGGKGKTSRKTPQEIQNWGERAWLTPRHIRTLDYNSRMTAKVDSALIQDGYDLYHHSLFFSGNGAWAVVQQGMNKKKKSARRYHWYSNNVKDLVCEPHTAISSQATERNVLNLTARESTSTRNLSAEFVNRGFWGLMKDIQLLRKHSSSLSRMAKYEDINGDQLTLLQLEDTEFSAHPVLTENFIHNKYLDRILYKLCDEKPESYEAVLRTEGVGGKTMRALSLVAEI
ncbi:hypothetical protein COV82_05850, partial [Candidatus Peregrinibacteria bacterium CG11_big_fil_rev_8_21_14_0_20_46_8]